jgi:hypothetical protein
MIVFIKYKMKVNKLKYLHWLSGMKEHPTKLNTPLLPNSNHAIDNKFGVTIYVNIMYSVIFPTRLGGNFTFLPQIIMLLTLFKQVTQ